MWKKVEVQNHSYRELTSIVESSELEEGIKEHICNVCGENKRER